MMQDLSVLIVAADPLVRAGLVAFLSDHEGLYVVGQETGETLQLIETYAPDVLLWDLEDIAPFAEESELLEDLNIPVVVLVESEALAKEALALGAQGILRHELESEQLAAALYAAARHLVVIADSLKPFLLRQDRPKGALELTPRELEVLQLLAEGLANKAIARKLNISEHTAKFHTSAILGKLGARSRTEAVALAARLGLILL